MVLQWTEKSTVDSLIYLLRDSVCESFYPRPESFHMSYPLRIVEALFSKVHFGQHEDGAFAWGVHGANQVGYVTPLSIQRPIWNKIDTCLLTYSILKNAVFLMAPLAASEPLGILPNPRRSRRDHDENGTRLV